MFGPGIVLRRTSIMVLHYGGKYKSEDDLKRKGIEHENAIPFREPDQTVFAVIANAGCVLFIILLIAGIWFLAEPDLKTLAIQMGIAAFISMALLIPHEVLHALCFKKDVYLYYNPSTMLVFVYGAESMSKSRFIFMSLLPNIVFGFLPYLMFIVHPEWVLCGLVGAFCIGMGFGDYINAMNAAAQMPKGARTYLYGFHSFWYMET